MIYLFFKFEILKFKESLMIILLIFLFLVLDVDVILVGFFNCNN